MFSANTFAYGKIIIFIFNREVINTISARTGIIFINKFHFITQNIIEFITLFVNRVIYSIL